MNPSETADPARSMAVLHGLTVLEFGARIGVSAAGSLLAQLGASVVFVESSTKPGGFAQPKWLHRDQFAAGKLSLAVDLRADDDRRLLDELAAECDVMLVSSDVDAAAYGTDFLRQVASCGIVCDLTAFGSTGPLAGQPATDAQVQALTGVMESTGLAGGPPMAIPLPLIEQLAGIYAASGVLAALRRPPGQAVEIALYDVAFSAMTSFLAPALGDAPDEISRVGNRHTMAAPWNVYRASDGWVLLCAGNDEQWQRICALTGEPERGLAQRLAKNADRVAHVDQVDALVQAWVGGITIAQCVESLSAIGIPCGPVSPIDGFPREANLQHRTMIFEAVGQSGRAIHLPGSPFRMSRSPGQPLLRLSAPDADREQVKALLRGPRRRSDAAAMDPSARPLAGIRVLEIGHYTTAPVATRLLASLGAEVIKVEPPEGEAVRHWTPSRNGQGVFFTFQNADKQSLVLDMASPDGRETLMKLVATSDVLIENLRPGALARKGFGPQQMLALNPQLVYCSISGFGVDSLYEGRAAFDTVIQAMSGLMDVNRSGDMPLKTGPSLADVIGAAFGLLAVLAALEHRRQTGEGQFLDLSMQDICAWATQTAWNHPAGPQAPGTLACSDGQVLVVEAPARAAESAAAAVSGNPSRAVLVEALRRQGVAAYPVLGVREVVAAPQTLERALWSFVEVDGIAHPVLASPVRLLGTPTPVPRPGPALGRDTEHILRSLPSGFGSQPAR